MPKSKSDCPNELNSYLYTVRRSNTHILLELIHEYRIRNLRMIHCTFFCLYVMNKSEFIWRVNDFSEAYI